MLSEEKPVHGEEIRGVRVAGSAVFPHFESRKGGGRFYSVRGWMRAGKRLSSKFDQIACPEVALLLAFEGTGEGLVEASLRARIFLSGNLALLVLHFELK
jgi:hypothetical protein